MSKAQISEIKSPNSENLEHVVFAVVTMFFFLADEMEVDN